jgi:hypothetical protein
MSQESVLSINPVPAEFSGAYVVGAVDMYIFVLALSATVCVMVFKYVF